MKKIAIEDAVDTVLAHDMTRITRGAFKGVAFKKGHVVRKEDIPKLLKIGKQHLYVLDIGKDTLHENDAARRISRAISDGSFTFSEPSEGKVNIIAQKAGLLKINVDALLAVNKMDGIIAATLKNNFPCRQGEIVAGTRIIPLTIPAKHIETLETLAKDYHPVLSIRTYHPMKIGAVITGSEVYKGLIRDDFDPSIGKKILEAGCRLVKKITVPDDKTAISNAVSDLEHMGCELIVTTGGLSVDPDDVTRMGVLRTGAQEIFYGSPVLPGAMLMFSMLNSTPILSLPACVFYYNRTVFDLIFPRILAGDTLDKNDIAAMGHGGLCMNCHACCFPICSFGG